MNQVSSSAPKRLTPRGKRTRQQLLDAAELVFGEKGFEQSSIAEITQRAEVALGTFYVYFENKKAIFVELVEQLGERLRKTLSLAVKGQATRLDKERAGFRAFFEFAGKHRNLYRIVRQAEFVDEAVYLGYYRTLAAAYARGLGKAMGAGELGRYDPEVIAYALMGIADFLGMRFVLWDKPEELERVVNEVSEFVAHGLLSPARRGGAK
ncbi:MAG: TetR/AcrR family transcriptional regulator [Myxococcus sp.]|nr:TetR/AcrR family transcriptional regulator [Myxococcus sp.]